MNADISQNKAFVISARKYKHISHNITEKTADEIICKSSRFKVNFGRTTISLAFLALLNAARISSSVILGDVFSLCFIDSPNYPRTYFLSYPFPLKRVIPLLQAVQAQHSKCFRNVGRNHKFCKYNASFFLSVGSP